jgi:hypothetical protein
MSPAPFKSSETHFSIGEGEKENVDKWRGHNLFSGELNGLGQSLLGHRKDCVL